MTALSIHIPDDLAKASQEAARKLGMSRSSFIRTAILHELQKLKSQFEQEAMAKSLALMQTNQQYLQELEEIETYLNTPLPDDGENWWKK